MTDILDILITAMFTGLGSALGAYIAGATAIKRLEKMFGRQRKNREQQT